MTQRGPSPSDLAGLPRVPSVRRTVWLAGNQIDDKGTWSLAPSEQGDVQCVAGVGHDVAIILSVTSGASHGAWAASNSSASAWICA